jgi:hypothetical protein
LQDGAERDRPKILYAVKAIQTTVGDGDPGRIRLENDAIYSVGLSIIFLVTLDPSKYSSEIQCLVDYLQLMQKDHGGWGYEDRGTGDTSMTQYGVLSAWEVTQAGFRVPTESIEGVATWLLKTQDPSGGFGYQGRISEGFTPIPQSGVQHSLTAAGLGSTYICADLLGMVVRAEQRDDGLPPALKEVKSEQEKQGGGRKPRTRLEPRLLQNVQGRGNHWMEANYVIDPKNWTYYYMYALERYMSFRELAEGKAAAKSGKLGTWYDDGVRLLMEQQKEDGSWVGQGRAVADTSFAVLFLLRSTKKSIEKARGFGDGTLIGGRGIPKETDRVVVRQGKVVARPLLGPAPRLLAILEDPETANYQKAIDALAELPPLQAEALISRHAEKLRRLAGDRSPEARIAAVSALAKTRDLNNVPTLIYALTDPHPAVVIEARDALRRISRRPSGFGLPEKPNEADRSAAVAKWKAWYLAVRPDAEFVN